MSINQLAGPDRRIIFDLVRVSEQGALAAARHRGRGNEENADIAAVTALGAELEKLDLSGTIIIGEPLGAPALSVGTTIGNGNGPQVDIAVDPLEGPTLCVKDLPNALVALVIADQGALLKCDGLKMEKLAIGGQYEPDLVHIDASPQDNIKALAAAKGVAPEDVTVCTLDRSRHARLIEAVRETGASLRLISDGDIAGVIAAVMTHNTGIDMYMGIGGAPEGVIAASALRCMGGQMQGRMVMNDRSDAAMAEALGIAERGRIYALEDMVGGNLIFAASGITDGMMLKGVRFARHMAISETIVMSSATGTQRRIQTRHRL
ncbi:MAG: fructose-bisphosphatase class II [Hyphomicrobiales bacterium]|nr:MAG: fructose-bisphosphatase class II [Hyphomicrobiales bacterium]